MRNNDIEKKKIDKNILKLVMQIFIIAFAGLLGGCAFKTFFESVGIIPTGLSGFSLILHNLFLKANISIPTSIFYLGINAILFLIALKVFGWKFLLLSSIGIGCYTIGMQFGAIHGIADLPVDEIDSLLYCIVGGMFMGLSIGIALRYGGSTGGSDVAGALINKYFPEIKTGYCLLGINILVIILSIVSSGSLYIGLYALVMTIISSMATNFVLDDSKQVVSFYIICDKDNEISEAILNRFHRGVTKLDVQGMFSKKEKSMLLSLIPKGQAHEMKKLVKEIDENAFVFSSTVSETLGDGNFMKELSIFKNKINNAKLNLKTNIKYKIKLNIKKEKIFKKRKKFVCYKQLENNLDLSKQSKLI